MEGSPMFMLPAMKEESLAVQSALLKMMILQAE